MTRGSGKDKDPARYVVSKDDKTGTWYAHMRGYPYVPVFGSIGTKAHATVVARLRNETRGMA